MLLEIFRHPNSLLHEMGEDHLESPRRIRVIQQALESSSLELSFHKAAAATPKEIKKVHSTELIDRLRQSQPAGGTVFTADTIANKYTYQAALTAAGGSIQAAVNTYKNHTFAMLRPPGHHATEQTAMGFCFFNNISIAAKHLMSLRSRKIAILDIDNHHGNGTQSTFYDDAEVLYMSLHASPEITFPGTGYIEEVGKGSAKGKTVNIPLPYRTSDQDYLYAFDTIFEPILRQFKPDTILVSLGLDSLDLDPYGALGLSMDCFTELGHRIGALNERVAKNRVGVFLEGGYKFEEIGKATVNFFNALLHHRDYSKSPLNPSKEIQRIVHNVRSVHRNYWYAI